MEKFKNALRSLLCFAVLCISVLAAIGGTLYLFYFGKPLFGVTNIFLTIFAMPCIAGAWDVLWNGKNSSLLK